MSESTIPTTPKQIAAQINAEAAAQTAGESNADPIGYDSVAGYEKFRLSEKYPGRLKFVMPLKARNVRKVDPFGMHIWYAPNGRMISQVYQLHKTVWIVILWPLEDSSQPSYQGEGPTVAAAYKAAHRDMRLGRYDKAKLLREKALAEDVVSMFGKMLLDRSEKVEYLEKCLQQAETQLRDLRSDDHVQDLRIKLDAALSKIDMLEKGQGGVRPGVGTITIPRTEWEQTVQHAAECDRRASRAESRCDDYKRQIARMEGQPATAGATS